jgi:hypothetical protein
MYGVLDFIFDIIDFSSPLGRKAAEHAPRLVTYQFRIPPCCLRICKILEAILSGR